LPQIQVGSFVTLKPSETENEILARRTKQLTSKPSKPFSDFQQNNPRVDPFTETHSAQNATSGDVARSRARVSALF